MSFNELIDAELGTVHIILSAKIGSSAALIFTQRRVIDLDNAGPIYIYCLSSHDIMQTCCNMYAAAAARVQSLSRYHYYVIYNTCITSIPQTF